MKKVIDKDSMSEVFHLQKAKASLLKTEPLKARKERLLKIKKWIMDHQSLIRSAAFEDLKKPARETDLSEIFPVLTEIRHAIAHLSVWADDKPYSPGLTYLGTSAFIRPEPKGVCLVISPWNYPFNLAMGPVVSALAAGNTVILKPSEFTPATNKVMTQLREEVFSEEVFALFEGDATVATELLSLPFDHIFFTGSPAVGKIVMEAASKHLTSVTLELGGKSPTIVDETASLKDAAHKIAWGKWLNAGQTCVAPDYLFVHESVRSAFLPELERYANALYGKEGAYTGIINRRHLERLEASVKDALEKGAGVHFGGGADKETCRMKPMVLTDVTENMDVLQTEIFGPILPVITFRELDEVIRFINARPKPLALYVFSTSKRNQQRILNETSSGTMVINDCVLQFTHPNLPFGGVNNSGIGKAHGEEGFREFSNQKSVLKQVRGFTIAKTVYPPYTKLKNWMIRLMVKYF